MLLGSLPHLEDGLDAELGVEGHFREVLVGEAEAIGAPGLAGVLRVLVHRHERLAAPRVAADGVHGEGRARRHDFGLHEGSQQRDEARRVALRRNQSTDDASREGGREGGEDGGVLRDGCVEG